MFWFTTVIFLLHIFGFDGPRRLFLFLSIYQIDIRSGSSDIGPPVMSIGRILLIQVHLEKFIMRDALEVLVSAEVKGLGKYVLKLSDSLTKLTKLRKCKALCVLLC